MSQERNNYSLIIMQNIASLAIRSTLVVYTYMLKVIYVASVITTNGITNTGSTVYWLAVAV